jgi:uncharacterized membrane protein YfcA
VTVATFALIAATVSLAAFVQATTGVGFALIVAPVLAFVAPELLPVSLLILMLPLNVYVAWRERAALDRRGAAWITGGRVAGTFGGVWVLTALSASALAIFIGAATIIAAAVTLFMPSFRPGRRSLVVAGVVTGVTETATGIGGPPLALVYQHHAAAILRSTIAFCFLVGELVSLAFLGVAGRTNLSQVSSAALLLPALVVGAALSRYAHQRLTDRVLRMFVLAFAIVSGAVLVVRA